MMDWLINRLDQNRMNFVNHYAAEDPFLFKMTGYLDNVPDARFSRARSEMALRATAVLVGVASAAASPKNVLYMIVDVRSPRSLPQLGLLPDP